MLAEERSGLEPVEVVVHVWLNDVVQAGVPDLRRPARRVPGRGGPAGGPRAQPSRRSTRSGAMLVRTRAAKVRATAARTAGWARRPTSRAAPASPAGAAAAAAGSPAGEGTARRHRLLTGNRAEQHPQPAQVDRDAEHRVGRGHHGEHPHPARDHRSQRHHLGDEAEQPGRQAGQGQQGQAQPAGQHRVLAQQPPARAVRREGAGRRRAAQPGERGHHGEGQQGGDDVGQQVAAAAGADRGGGHGRERQDHPAGLGDGRPGEQAHDVVLAQRHDVAEGHAQRRRGRRRR